MQDFSWRVKPKTKRTEEARRPETEGPFDTSRLALNDDTCGFDPYAKDTLRMRPKGPPRTDLRALSAQILAERARKQSVG